MAGSSNFTLMPIVLFLLVLFGLPCLVVGVLTCREPAAERLMHPPSKPTGLDWLVVLVTAGAVAFVLLSLIGLSHPWWPNSQGD